MEVSNDEVEHVARLARLGIDASEATLFSAQLSRILTYFEDLKEINTQTQASFATTPMHEVFRLDEPETSLPRERALMNAPEADGTYFQVPKIMD